MAQPNQVVLITGASKGFGFAAAQELAARGHHVVATMRHPDRDGEAVRRGHESRIEATVCDVTDPASVRDAVAYALSRHGRIDVLVNNAGDVMWGAVEDLTDDELSLQLNTNVLGPLRLIRAVLPTMRKQGGGKIINLSSVAGRISGPIVGAYSASKFALEALSESLRYETAHWGIQIVLVQPGVVKTDLLFGGATLARALQEGRSLYQKPAQALLDGARAAVQNRPGPRTVASTIADLVDTGGQLPLRVPVGDDAIRTLALRHAMTDDEFEAMFGSLRDPGYPGSFFQALAEERAP